MLGYLQYADGFHVSHAKITTPMLQAIMLDLTVSKSIVEWH